MSNIFKDAFAWQTEQLRTHAGEEVVYRRGNDSVTVTAIRGKKLLKLDSADGVRYEYTDLDLLIPADDLDFGAGPITPERGDVAEVTTGATTDAYEVFPFNGEPPWEWSNPHHSMLRVHFKRLGAIG